MLEKPGIKDETLIAVLRERYGIPAAELEFLPIGHDSNAGVYRVRAHDGTTYFAKVKKGALDEASVMIPRYLKDHGLRQVVAPLHTVAHDPYTHVDDFALLLYPFIDGSDGMTLGLTDRQWVEYGTIVRRIHTTRLPAELLAQVPRETFVPNPQWCGIVKALPATIEDREHTGAAERELAAFWKERRAEIRHIVARAEALGRALQASTPEFVLCHADIHTANILVDGDGQLFVVDWDQPTLAPKERDLMFVVGSPIGRRVAKSRQEELFLRGYGDAAIDWLALSYYRYEWAVQDMGSFAELVFLRDDVGEETQAEAARLCLSQFRPGGIVDAAYASERHLPPELRSSTP
jgi:spectinomycin phosphotransferase